ncbi:MAG TPA: tol-pal system protein YbgF [Thermoanaerobaculia bacterium]|nr:tol-pal system protein YbgF [Thermoanaerobaculia bacterium]
MLRPIALVAAAATFAATGCVSTSDFEAAQRQIAELQEELANVKRTAAGKEEVQGVNERIASQTETLLKSNATLVAKVSDIEERIQTTTGAIEQSNYRMDSVTQQLAQIRKDIDDVKSRVTAMETAQAAAPATPATTPGAPSGSQVTVPATPAASTADPTDVYQAAYRDYQRGNYDLAIEGFREFLDINQVPDLADNASYWIGESLFSQKKYREAIEEFDRVVTKYPKSDKVPGALLKKGYAYISIGEKAQGVVQLQYVLHEHPKSPEAALAKQKLKQLGIETK